MSEHEVKLTSEERQVMRARARRSGLDSVALYVEKLIAARLADAEARAEAAEATLARVEALAEKWDSAPLGRSRPPFLVAADELGQALRGDQ